MDGCFFSLVNSVGVSLWKGVGFTFLFLFASLLFLDEMHVRLLHFCISAAFRDCITEDISVSFKHTVMYAAIVHRAKSPAFKLDI